MHIKITNLSRKHILLTLFSMQICFKVLYQMGTKYLHQYFPQTRPNFQLKKKKIAILKSVLHEWTPESADPHWHPRGVYMSTRISLKGTLGSSS